MFRHDRDQVCVINIDFEAVGNWAERNLPYAGVDPPAGSWSPTAWAPGQCRPSEMGIADTQVARFLKRYR